MATGFAVDKLIGAALIGFFVSSVYPILLLLITLRTDTTTFSIYGITWLQVYAYYTKYCTRDGLFLKIFVAVLMALDTFHSVLLLVIVYHYAVSNFGDYTTLEHGTWGLVWQSFVGGNLQGIIQMSFAYRIYSLSGKKLVFPMIIGTFCMAKTATLLGFVVTALQLEPLGTRAGSEFKKWAISTLGCAIACDLMIAGCIAYYLRKSNANFKGTRNAIRLLITYALNTCLLTSVFNLVTMMLWIKESETMLYDLFFFIAVRLYSCAFMSTLDPSTH
ncbi:hypothetical protein C8J56DRAFT_1057570 [Mycena floridula]|nr:hypothetical protein C8J56DRAFT_1057570 [Mycena floridula]